ncbi:hypothetical protein ACF0H5_000789 [Mactra antiquata]
MLCRFWSLFFLGFVMLPCVAALSQSQLDNLASSMSISLKVVQNLRYDGNNHTVRLTINNMGQDDIPGSDWRLYFHNMYLVAPGVFPSSKTLDLNDEKIRLGMVQGDLYYLEPITGFVPIKPADMREYYIVSQWASISRTDFMPQWYLTSDGADPRIVETTASLDLENVEQFDDVRTWKRNTGDRYNPFTAQQRMRRLGTENSKEAVRLVLPTPKHIDVHSDKPKLTLDETWTIYTEQPVFESTALYLKENTNFDITQSKPDNKCIVLKTMTDTGVHGSYQLETDAVNTLIYLSSNDVDGMFYASQSLRSLLDGYSSKDIPTMKIDDEPRYQYRGMYIDVARNFHTVEDIKRLMKVMAMYKMNKLHLHLSDDEGWRVEIAGLPELTQIGGNRCHDLQENKCVIPQFGSGPFMNSSGSGFYTESQYKDILSFANEHHIHVIPEFDMPGHAHAAIVSMEARYRKYNETGNKPEAERYRLVDPDDESVYMSVQQWLDNAINPCINSTYAFIEKVIDGMVELHKDVQPLDIYHFGGDEVAHGVWELSPTCENFLIRNPQYNVTKGIKTYFLERVSKLVADRGLNLAGWEDGFTDGKSDPISIDKLANNVTYTHAWNNIWEWGSGKHSYQLANAGYKVILAQATNVYFDHPQEPDPEERGLYWATRFTDTMKVLKFLPDKLYDNIFEERSGKRLTKHDVCGDNMEKCDELKKPDNIIGIQGELWSETVRTSENVDYMIFPRLLALAERAWYKAEFEDAADDTREDSFRQEWKAFANTLGQRELLRLDNVGVKYRVPPPGGRVNADNSVELSPIYPGLGIQTSNDGGQTWPDLLDRLIWQDGKTLHARTVSAKGDRYSRPVQIHKDEPVSWTDQHDVDYIADNLDVFVSVIDNLEKDDGYMRLNMVFRNTGTVTIPVGTWRLYQYSLYGLREEVVQCGLQVRHVNGGLFYVTPDPKSFKPIPPGGKLTCTIYNKYWLVSRTDNMPNWYVTSFGMTPKVIGSTTGEDLSYVGAFRTQEQWRRTKDDKYDPYANWLRYDMYTKFDSPQRQPYKVVPTPLSVTSSTSSKMKFITANWKVVDSSDFPFEAKYISESLEIEKTSTAPTNKAIVFENGRTSESHPEAYMLHIDAPKQKILIKANTASGAFYGVQTLISLIEGNNGELIETVIIDKPRYDYRGIMIDTARNFKPVKWILKMIDAMSMYKLNKLHFHLTDDEGWRIEIPSIPELTEVGSQRCHSDYDGDCVIPQLGSGPDNTTSGTGFYTVDEYKSILKYANDRHIEVIPEIETPGHATAAMVAMEYRDSKIEQLKKYGVQDLPESYRLMKSMNKNVVTSPQKWTNNAIDPCLNTSYSFVSKVIDDLIKIHKDVQTLKVIHIGGDEVPEGAWADSQACFDAGKEPITHELQRDFVARVGQIVADKGLNLAVWDDGVYANDQPYPREDYTSENST